jgi:ATP-dependent Zn protease
MRQAKAYNQALGFGKQSQVLCMDKEKTFKILPAMKTQTDLQEVVDFLLHPKNLIIGAKFHAEYFWWVFRLRVKL